MAMVVPTTDAPMRAPRRDAVKKTAVLLSLLLLAFASLPARADHWPEPFAYLNGTAPREPEFSPCPREIVTDAECATQLDALNQTSYLVLRKDGVIVRVIQILLEGRLALTIYPLPKSTGK